MPLYNDGYNVLFLYVIHEIIGQKTLNITQRLSFQILIHPTFRYIENKSYVFRCFSKAFTRSVFISFNLTPRGLKGAVYRIHKYVHLFSLVWVMRT